MKTAIDFWEKHNFWASWLILGVGMVAILLWAGWHVGFTLRQWAALIVITLIVAGLASWIISWESDDE